MTERPIWLRLDRESALALRRIMRTRGLTHDAAIKTALVEAAKTSLANEAVLLCADEADRAEVAQVRAHMDALRG
jgi:hypothetical protein